MSAPLNGGASTVLASSQKFPAAIAADGTTVYWADSGNFNSDGTVMAVSKDGGTPTVLASAQDAPWAVAVDDTSVYWVNLGTFTAPLLPSSTLVPPPSTASNYDGSVVKMPKGGGPVTTLVSGIRIPGALLASVGLCVTAIATDSTSVYWTDFGSEGAVSRVMKVPKEGGAPVTLVAVPVPPGAR